MAEPSVLDIMKMIPEITASGLLGVAVYVLFKRDSANLTRMQDRQTSQDKDSKDHDDDVLDQLKANGEHSEKSVGHLDDVVAVLRDVLQAVRELRPKE